MTNRKASMFLLFLLVLFGMLSSMRLWSTKIQAQQHPTNNFYTFDIEIMGENHTIAIETNGTIENFRYSNFTFGWGEWFGGEYAFYNITIAKTLNNTAILARSGWAQGAYKPDVISMNETHYFIYYDAEWQIVDVFFGAPSVEISLSCSTAYVGFTVEINGNVTYRGKSVSNWPVFLVAYHSPLKGNVWAWEWMYLPLTLITTVNTTTDGAFSAAWMPTATGNWWISAGLANPWPATDGDYPEDASASVSLTVTPYANEHAFSVVSNVTVSELAFNTTSQELSFTAEGLTGTKGFVDVYISKGLLADLTVLDIYLNSTLLSPEEYTVSSTNESWRIRLIVNFTSKYDVVIVIPEFPSFMIPALFMIATLLSVIVYRRKH